jgi:hypothetical protein
MTHVIRRAWLNGPITRKAFRIMTTPMPAPGGQQVRCPKDPTGALRVVALLLVLAVGLPSASFEWYWKDKAHIPAGACRDFWGDDFISNAFCWVCEKVFVPGWNFVFAIEGVRYVVAIIFAGFLAGLGADLYKMVKKSSQVESGPLKP